MKLCPYMKATTTIIRTNSSGVKHITKEEYMQNCDERCVFYKNVRPFCYKAEKEILEGMVCINASGN